MTRGHDQLELLYKYLLNGNYDHVIDEYKHLIQGLERHLEL